MLLFQGAALRYDGSPLRGFNVFVTFIPLSALSTEFSALSFQPKSRTAPYPYFLIPNTQRPTPKTQHPNTQNPNPLSLIPNP